MGLRFPTIASSGSEVRLFEAVSLSVISTFNPRCRVKQRPGIVVENSLITLKGPEFHVNSSSATNGK